MNSKKVVRALSKLRDRAIRELKSTVNPEDNSALSVVIAGKIVAGTETVDVLDVVKMQVAQGGFDQ